LSSLLAVFIIYNTRIEVLCVGEHMGICCSSMIAHNNNVQTHSV
jgi:hypothetical protein